MPKVRNSKVTARKKPYERERDRSRSPRQNAEILWGEVRCPICMEPPHNAVLLLCDQHEHGCKPYMCDTSRRHTNCLDQFKKTREQRQQHHHQSAQGGHAPESRQTIMTEASGPNLIVIRSIEGGNSVEMVSIGVVRRENVSQQQSPQPDVASYGRPSQRTQAETQNHIIDQIHSQARTRALSHVQMVAIADAHVSAHAEAMELAHAGGVTQPQGEGVEHNPAEDPFVQGSADDSEGPIMAQASSLVEALRTATVARAARTAQVDKLKALGDGFMAAESGLQCPLCRGTVLGWKAATDARSYLNLRPRVCAAEECEFSGSYIELRKHARKVHPLACPQEVNPSRMAAWERMESQNDRQDLLSTIQSVMPSGRLFGDYLVEDEEGADEQYGDLEGDIDLLLPMMEVLQSLNHNVPPLPNHWSQGRMPPWTPGIPYPFGGRPMRRSLLGSRDRGARPAMPPHPPAGHGLQAFLHMAQAAHEIGSSTGSLFPAAVPSPSPPSAFTRVPSAPAMPDARRHPSVEVRSAPSRMINWLRDASIGAPGSNLPDTAVNLRPSDNPSRRIGTAGALGSTSDPLRLSESSDWPADPGWRPADPGWPPEGLRRRWVDLPDPDDVVVNRDSHFYLPENDVPFNSLLMNLLDRTPMQVGSRAELDHSHHVFWTEPGMSVPTDLLTPRGRPSTHTSSEFEVTDLFGEGMADSAGGDDMQEEEEEEDEE